MRTRFAGNRAWIPKALPVRRWQAKQWHMEIRIGSPSAVSRSCPQLQAASRVTMAADPTEADAQPRATSSIEVLLLAPECGSKRLIAQRLEHVALPPGLCGRMHTKRLRRHGRTALAFGGPVP